MERMSDIKYYKLENLNDISTLELNIVNHRSVVNLLEMNGYEVTEISREEHKKLKTILKPQFKSWLARYFFGNN